MVERVETAVVRLWGMDVGAVSWLADRRYGVFEYHPDFLERGLDIAPLHMGLDAARQGDGLFAFPGLNPETYMGLPGLLADALPDKFGNNIIAEWLARNGRDPADFSPVERLCYTGRRAMGALSFAPAIQKGLDRPVEVAVGELVALAQGIMAQRLQLDTALGASANQDADAILDILRVGTSAGGARPKAVIAIDDQGKVISGQGDVPAGFDYWVLKFDGVSDLELGEPKGFGRIEYAYSLMARDAGIEMMPCRLLEENGRAHFMTQRFDRVDGGKVHMQSLCGVAHYDFNRAGAYSYEQAFSVMRQLRLPHAQAVEQYRRMLFNVVSRNQDDHTKNIAFLMGRDGRWRLSPAFDVIYAHNPAGQWTHQHQMSINGKRHQFTRADLMAVGEAIRIPRPQRILEQIMDSVGQWPRFAAEAGVHGPHAREIARHHRLVL